MCVMCVMCVLCVVCVMCGMCDCVECALSNVSVTLCHFRALFYRGLFWMCLSTQRHITQHITQKHIRLYTNVLDVRLNHLSNVFDVWLIHLSDVDSFVDVWFICRMADVDSCVELWCMCRIVMHLPNHKCDWFMRRMGWLFMVMSVWLFMVSAIPQYITHLNTLHNHTLDKPNHHTSKTMCDCLSCLLSLCFWCVMVWFI